MTPHKPQKQSSENPYLSARREWNERYGDYITAAKNWRNVAIAALGVAAAAVAGVAWIGAQTKIVPYVVEVNKLGEAVGVTRADVALPADQRLIKAQLARFVTCLRTVTADVAVQRRLVFELYSMLSSGDPATTTVSTEMKAHSPFERAASETVSVDISNLLPLSGETWQVDWSETRRDRRGAVIDVTRWRASVTIAFQQPKTEQDLLKNPIGLYAKELAWSPQLLAK